MTALKKKSASAADNYHAFDRLDGSHPWTTEVPEGAILYPARKLKTGKVTYFNFHLAKEMGLIDASHPHRLNKRLEKKILDTFDLRILNEYDQEHGIEFPKAEMKENKFMATRYLQLQHPDKTGRTSGDGRGIWNGCWNSESATWDVSSRGTGVTALAPGVVKAGKPLPSGCEDYGYSCGMAELDELYAAALLSEIFHRQGYNTERVLAVIDNGNGVGIGVRSGKNLLRPAHLFLYLKQGKLEPLKKATDFLIKRQYENKTWNISPRSPQKYQKMLERLAQDFARFAAYMERDYVFAWLDWDGDNVLADAGIIDYGSVRLFGLRHDQYRYDDVERYSTNLNEQRLKARLILQVFAQMVDFLESGEKKPLPQFKNHKAAKAFDQHFQHSLLERFVWQLGFPKNYQRILLNKHLPAVKKFYQTHSDLERLKTYRKMQRVPDGLNRPAILNLRSAMAEMPKSLLEKRNLSEKDFFKLMIAQSATPKDRKLSERLKKKIRRWQRGYATLLHKVSPNENGPSLLKILSERAGSINRDDRITGNALIGIVEEIMAFDQKTSKSSPIQAVVEEFIDHQTLNPDFKSSYLRETTSPAPPPQLMETLLLVLQEHNEDI
jgi:uncharacterized protein YdiU (UPF0061 family)